MSRAFRSYPMSRQNYGGGGYSEPQEMAPMLPDVQPQSQPTRFQAALDRSRSLDALRAGMYAQQAPTFKQAKEQTAPGQQYRGINIGSAPGQFVAAPEPQTTRKQLPNGGWELTGPKTPAMAALAEGQATAGRNAYAQTKMLEGMMNPEVQRAMMVQNQQKLGDAAAYQMMYPTPTPQKPVPISAGGAIYVDGKLVQNPREKQPERPLVVPSGGKARLPDGTIIDNPAPVRPQLVPEGAAPLAPDGTLGPKNPKTFPPTKPSQPKKSAEDYDQEEYMAELKAWNERKTMAEMPDPKTGKVTPYTEPRPVNPRKKNAATTQPSAAAKHPAVPQLAQMIAQGADDATLRAFLAKEHGIA